MNLDFLNNVELDAVVKTAPKAKSTTPKLPTEADLRVFANGQVYPSAAFAAKYNLEFVPKAIIEGVDGKESTTVVVGNGLDVFSSKTWGMIAGKLPEDQQLIFCAAVAKSAAKVDMWASTKYEDNEPKASVFTQGSNTFAKKVLVPMITDIYGVNWDEVEYVDMTVKSENVIASPNGLYHLPKTVSTGEHKGKADYIRRENLTICPLVVAHLEPKEIKATGKVDMFAEAATTEQPKTVADMDAEEDADWALGKAQKVNAEEQA